jgi:N utilization substance protein B
MRRRRKSRILALSMLYALEVQHEESTGVAHPVLNMYSRRFDKSVEEYALHLVHGVAAHRDELDRMVREQAFNWDFNRITPVDRQVMRIALFEMLYDRQTPAAVCINEAIDIGKLYSTSESGHFINGILDAIRKQHDIGAPAQP